MIYLVIIRKNTSTKYNFQFVENIEGRSPDIFVAKDVLWKISRVSGGIFQFYSIKDIRATLLNYPLYLYCYEDVRATLLHFQFNITGQHADNFLFYQFPCRYLSVIIHSYKVDAGTQIGIHHFVILA